METQPIEPFEQPGAVLVVDARPRRSERLTALLEAEGRRALVAASLESALGLLAREQPDVLLVEYGILESSGAMLAERVDALAPWAAIVASGPRLGAGVRRDVVRRLDLHGFHEEDEETAGDPAALLGLVESACASARRSRRALLKSELRELIVAKLCHEIRTCLYVVQGYAEILSGGRDDAARDEVAARIGAVSAAALGTVQEYLDLARLALQSAAGERQRVELDALLEELRAHAEWQIGSRPLRIRVEVTEPGAVLKTDGEKLRGILSQLLANAIKFTPEGEICLEVRPEADATEFVVRDDGAGIDEAVRPTLFAPFSQRPGGSLSSIPGQGLGLAIALRLSRLLGASLDADTAPGGARFRLCLPVRAEPRSRALEIQEIAVAARLLH